MACYANIKMFRMTYSIAHVRNKKISNLKYLFLFVDLIIYKIKLLLKRLK